LNPVKVEKTTGTRIDKINYVSINSK